jgi:hypothetical protein
VPSDEQDLRDLTCLVDGAHSTAKRGAAVELEIDHRRVTLSAAFTCFEPLAPGMWVP